MQAHNAAMAGLAAGIRRMHANSWSGVNTSFSGAVNSNDTYTVSYVAGDSQLLPTDPNFRDWHLRVTVVATGKSTSPTSTDIYSTHEVRAVAQLVPRALGTQPSQWSQVANYVLYQTSNAKFTMQVPGRVEGPVRLQGEVELGEDLSWSSTTRSRYYSDLNEMRTARNEIQTVTVNGNGSYRLHFNGQTTSNLSHNASASSVRTALRNLGTIGNNNVEVSGSNGGPYTVTFIGALGNQDVPQLIGQNVSLSGFNSGVWTTLTRQGSAGYPDCRPLTGPVNLPLSATDTTNRNLITSLDVNPTNISVSSAMTLPLPQVATNYRIYPGGPTYQIPQVGGNLSQTTLEPDPHANPLGIFFCGSPLTLNNNVSVSGTLVCGAHANLRGNNVNIQGIPLWPLSGSSTPVQLPALVVRRDLQFSGNDLNAKIRGMAIVGERFVVEEGSESVALAMEGKLVTRGFELKRRTQWNYVNLIWSLYYSTFTSQVSATDGMPFFPIFMATLGRSPIPTLTLKNDQSPLANHWQDLAEPLYKAHASDPGLLWTIVRLETGG
jgi:hypothetical protein